MPDFYLMRHKHIIIMDGRMQTCIQNDQLLTVDLALISMLKVPNQAHPYEANSSSKCGVLVKGYNNPERKPPPLTHL